MFLQSPTYKQPVPDIMHVIWEISDQIDMRGVGGHRKSIHPIVLHVTHCVFPHITPSHTDNPCHPMPPKKNPMAGLTKVEHSLMLIAHCCTLGFGSQAP
jgi:hypothetical protein